MLTPKTIRRQSAFTLVELLVAAALSLLIMAVIATAFQTGLSTLSHLKSMGELADRLRTVETSLRTDLQATHFELANGTPTQAGITSGSPAPIRLSDIRLDRVNSSNRFDGPPQRGYIQIRQGQPSIIEGIDGDGLPSTSATTHSLSMTIKRDASAPEEMFSTNMSQIQTNDPTLYNSMMTARLNDTVDALNNYSTRWATVDWFLANPVNVGNVQTFALYRRVRLLTDRTINVNPATRPLLDDLFSVAPTANLTNDSLNVQTLQNRPLAVPIPQTSTKAGYDLVLTNVLSFEVKASWQGGPVPPRADLTVNPDFPFDDLPPVTENTGLAGQRIFDTWTRSGPNWSQPGGADSVPMRIRITALQIKIRVYDQKNSMARQVTLVVEM